MGSTLAIAFICVLGLGVPLAILARHQVWTAARDRIGEQAASVASGVEDRLDAGQPIDLRRYALLMPERRIVVTTAAGRTVRTGPQLHGALLQASIRVADSTVTVQAERQTTAVRAREVTLVVAALALLTTLAAVALALWQARRLARPIADLVTQADALGRAEFAVSPLHSGVPEIDRVSRVLERSSRQVGALVDLQRHFAADAAHQLRTPLTSIGLHLDEVSRLGDETLRAEAEEALAQVERLNGVITALLARARGDAVAPAVIDLPELVAESCAGWDRILGSHDRLLVLDIAERAQVLARRDHVTSVLASLLENALHHGDGVVTVTVDRMGDSARVRVRDQGRGVPAALAPSIFDRRVSGDRGTGIGLALAHALAAAESGSLRLSEHDPAEFVLTLPRWAAAARSAPPAVAAE